ncbi:SDR family oxidoreductase [Acetobacteraceae bacterium]|nr:SDR family oxidoreductase [Acetobacteraceae bacterium]
MTERNTDAIPKAALVTGGAKRIGRALVKRLVQEGYAVAIHYHESSLDAEMLLEEIMCNGGKACLLKGNLSQKNIAEQLITAAYEKIGPLGILINNAAYFEKDTIETLTPACLEKHFAPNVRAPLFLIQKFSEQLPKGKKGLILNLLDQSVLNPCFDFISYNLSKSALWTLTQTLALALAPSIRVNAIAPGAVLPAKQQTDEHFNRMWKNTPLQLKTTPEEIAEAMMGFITLGSVTGQILALDGGQHLK